MPVISNMCRTKIMVNDEAFFPTLIRVPLRCQPRIMMGVRNLKIGEIKTKLIERKFSPTSIHKEAYCLPYRCVCQLPPLYQISNPLN